ncbi:uncharacterized protein BDW70DRAFT_167337 [Aspergillus foveolatus]|uniref:uncharacterized protein n=1 Tax=Aspergillus foveolatus TaxID=210207 RepID=UPI003CCCCB55
MIFIILFINFAWSHSWVEQLSVIGRNGLTQGPPGYPRGNVLRSSPTFNDYAMTYLVPDPSGNDAICAPSQRQQIQTEGSPRLRSRPGDRVLIRYQENGHVTLPWVTPGKPSPGTVYIYSTTSPSEKDTLLDVHRVWNEDGTGGDGRGRLLGIFGFDDGRCFQVNEGPISRYRQGRFGHAPDALEGSDLWCGNVVLLPDNINSDVLSLYWVWDWPTNPGKADEKQEIYTTCMDIQIDTTSSAHCM